MPLVQSVSLSANPSPLVKLGLDFAHGMIDPDLPRMEATMAEDYHHVFLLGSVVPSLTTRDQYMARMKAVLPVFGEITADLKEVIVSDDTNTIVLHISVTRTFSSGDSYANDNLLIMHADKKADGSLKFVDCKEFMNTKMGEDLMAKIRDRHE